MVLTKELFSETENINIKYRLVSYKEIVESTFVEYSIESWTIGATEYRSLEAFEVLYCQPLLRVK